MKPKFFDIHSHINFSTFDKDREEVITRMTDESVWAISVGTDLKTSKEVVELAENNANIFATVGLHPDSHKGLAFVESDYKELIKNKKMVAIGECGLDYFRIKDDAGNIKKEQKENFEKQIEFALENDLPLMIHCRPSIKTMDAYEDVYDILSSFNKIYGDKLRGNFHFFAGSLDIAKKFLSIGFTLSFTGVITFTDSYDEIIKYTPLDMLMTETDCPFVAPVPYRGGRNEPIYVIEVVKRISEIKGGEFEKIREALVNNALQTFLR